MQEIHTNEKKMGFVKRENGKKLLKVKTEFRNICPLMLCTNSHIPFTIIWIFILLKKINELLLIS